MTIRFGIAGCGMIAGFHARALAEVEGAELVACTSRNPASAERFAGEHHCQSHSSLTRMLDQASPEAVCICTPSGAHLDPALEVAAAGRHLVIEKPLEITPARCDRIIQACRDHDVRLATIFQSRFHPAAQAIKQAVQRNRLGTLAIGSAAVKWHRSQEYYDSGAWRGTRDLDGGGALMNQAIHTVDLLQWIMGPVREVSAFATTRSHERIEVEDTLVAALEFANGALGTIEATTSAWPGWQKRIEICGSAGSVRIEDETIERWELEKPADNDPNPARISPADDGLTGGATDPSSIGHAAHRMQLQNFVDTLRGQGELLVDGSEGRKSVGIISAVYESVRKQRPVTPDEAGAP